MAKVFNSSSTLTNLGQCSLYGYNITTLPTNGVPFTWGAWIYPTGVPNSSANQSILTLFDNNTSSGYYDLGNYTYNWKPPFYDMQITLLQGTPNTVLAANEARATSLPDDFVGLQVPQSGWLFVVGVFDYGTISTYVGYPNGNGQYNISSQFINRNNALYTLSTVNFSISSAGLGFDGLIGPVNVWKELLSYNEIYNMANGLPAHLIRPSSIILSYGMIGPSSVYEQPQVSNTPVLLPVNVAPTLATSFPAVPTNKIFGPKLQPKPSVDTHTITLYSLGCLPYGSGGGSFDTGSFNTGFNNIVGCGNPPAWSIPLYLNASQSMSSGNITLYTTPVGFISNLTGSYDGFGFNRGFDNGNPLPFFIGAPITSGNNTITLFVGQSPTLSSGYIPLFTFGQTPGTGIYNTIPLVMNVNSGLITNMSLYLQGVIPNSGLNSLSLYMYSTTYSGIYDDMTLFMSNPYSSGYNTSSMNLYLCENMGLGDSASMNLYLGVLNSVNPPDNNNIPLYISGPNFVSGFIPLFMAAPSGTLGAIPFSGNLNLVMGRTNAAANNITMYTFGPQGWNSGIPLYLDGQPVATSGISLVMLNPNVENSGFIKLFTEGF